MVLGGFDGGFSGVDAVVVRLRELDLRFFLVEEVAYYLGALIVEDMQVWIVSLLLQFLIDALKYVHHGCVLSRWHCS